MNGNVESAQRTGLFGSNSTIDGNVIGLESGQGDASLGIFAPGAVITGDIELKVSGDADIYWNGSVEVNGNIKCDGSGSDSNIPLAFQSIHSDTASGPNWSKVADFNRSTISACVLQKRR